MTIAFIQESLHISNFSEFLKQVRNGVLLVNTINRASSLMCEELGDLLIFNKSDKVITLKANISNSSVVNVCRLCKAIRKYNIKIVNDTISAENCFVKLSNTNTSQTDDFIYIQRQKFINMKSIYYNPNIDENGLKILEGNEKIEQNNILLILNEFKKLNTEFLNIKK